MASSFFSFKKIFGPYDKSAIGIDIGSSSIKVIELRKEKGRAVLKTYGELALGPYVGATVGSIRPLPNEKIGEALRDVLKEAGITSKNAGVAIPFRSSLVSLIEMPMLPEKKLEEMIPIEARKYIPVPISEVTLDWWVVPKEKYDSVEDAKKEDTAPVPAPKDRTDVLVVSIHNEILNDYNNIVKENSLDASFFEIEMFSAARALISKGDGASMIFDFGAAGTKLYVIDRGIIRASHIINRGSQDITQAVAKSFGIEFVEAEKIKRNIPSLRDADKKTVLEVAELTLDYLWSETKNIISNYESKYHKKISKIIITGGGVALPGFAELAEKQLSVKVEMADPFSKVESPAFLAGTLKTAGLEFSVAIGSALRKLEELS